MTAAVLIGAARGAMASPAALLAHLNDVLVDMCLGGFVTCLCAELSSAARLTSPTPAISPPIATARRSRSKMACLWVFCRKVATPSSPSSLPRMTA